MDILEQAEAVKEALMPVAAAEGGKAFVASDLLHLWSIAYQNTQGLRVIICFNGLDMRGGDTYGAILGRADVHWLVGICRGRGFNAERDQSQLGTSVNAKPFYQLIAEVRDVIRALIGASVEAPVDFRRIRPMPMNEGSLVDGYLIEFDLVCDLPALVDGSSEVPDISAPELETLFTTCPTNPDQGSSVMDCINQPSVSAVMQGQAGKIFDVTFASSGIYEGKVYNGSTPVNGDRVASGGTPNNDENNIVKLEVSSPAGTYWLNYGRINGLAAIVEQSFTIPVAVGATVTLTIDSITPFRESTNFGSLTIPNFAGILPNWGQWVSLSPVSFQQLN